MNIHEYQGKAILSQFGVAVPAGIVVDDAAEAAGAALTLQEKTGTNTWVVKAQIHAGGRGKGGGVKLARNIDEVTQTCQRYPGNAAGYPADRPGRQKSTQGAYPAGYLLSRRIASP